MRFKHFLHSDVSRADGFRPLPPSLGHPYFLQSDPASLSTSFDDNEHVDV